MRGGVDITVDCANLKRFVVTVLESVGVTSESAQIAAEVLVTTDMRGVRTHGTRQLPGYVQHILRGGISPKADMLVLREGPNWAIVDGNAGLGVVTAHKSMRLAISKAKDHVIGIVGVRNSNHFGAAGYYATLCAHEDMIGIAMTNGDPTMSVPGAMGRVLSNNPLAYAFPASDRTTVDLDISFSGVAGSKIHQAARENRAVPEGLIVDVNGLPTTDPRDFENGGAHIPIGGHKGFGLALMVEILTGVLTGAGVTKEVMSFVEHPSQPSQVGHLFLAIDIAPFVPLAVFKARVNKLATEIREFPKSSDADRIYIPGEMEREEEENAKIHGIALDDATATRLRLLAQDLGLHEALDSIS
jgi:LDH2 family malate/lactate/ureidoglycolate dehydrogenase